MTLDRRNRATGACGLLLCLFAMTGCSPSSAPPAPAERPPNIVFFIADDMTPDMFNVLPEGEGRNLTPNLDRLAAEGTLLLGQHVASPVCTPSRYNVLTGRYASRARNEAFLERTVREEGQTVVEWNSFITGDDRTLAHRLRDAGYRTGMIGKNHVLEARDFYVFPDYDADPRDPAIEEKLKQNSALVAEAARTAGFDFAARLYHNNPNFLGLGQLAVQNLDWMAEGGLEFIRQAGDEPFFLYFATTVPHAPTVAERSWDADPTATADGFLDQPPTALPPRSSLPERLKSAGIDEEGRENLLWLDDTLGALISALDDGGILDDTVVFFFNDHGQNAKGTVYQGGVLNPSVVWRAGGFAVGSSPPALVSNVDFAPTILDLAGVAYDPAEFDGRSFAPVLDGEAEEVHESLYFELGYVRGVRKGRWKYIALRYPEYARTMSAEERARVLEEYNARRRFRHMVLVTEDPTLPFSHLSAIPGGGHAEVRSTGRLPGYFDPDQLYDLESDQGELHNLAGDPAHAEVLAELKGELQRYLADLPGDFPLETP